ncbi:MAG: hypothetical protein BMS9Abin03_268 [Thermodesulfobacteriota bacterium]|nr:MAG: hypothetical protein BMS9Abin03_268 [Thermodesulfobacteriota bacterium]
MIYIDTGAFLARHLSKDQYHHQANAFWDSIRKKSETCVTSNFVLDETLPCLVVELVTVLRLKEQKTFMLPNCLISSGPAEKKS